MYPILTTLKKRPLKRLKFTKSKLQVLDSEVVFGNNFRMALGKGQAASYPFKQAEGLENEFRLVYDFNEK